MTGSGAALRVEPARGGRPFRDFLRLPHAIYADDPNWVAPLRRDVRTMFDPAKHPFHEHSEVEPFVARRGKTTVGRIVAIHNRNHVAFHDEPVGFFGFFECEDRQETADALFEAAAAWLRARELEVMRGPASFSTNEQVGLLVDGFDMQPVVMMPYNPPYYERLIEAAGFEKAQDLLALHLVLPEIPEFLLKRERRLAKRLDVTVRHIDMDDFEAELDRVRQLYNAAWERNWGFVPMTEAEIRFMAHELEPLLKKDPEQVVIVEDEDGEPIGFALWLKDYNQALKHADGKLFPFGLLKILWHARSIDMGRVLTLGLVPEHRQRGIDNLLYLRIIRAAHAKGIIEGEFSWILEQNLHMLTPLQKMGAETYKRYRIFDRVL
ncbi:MAG: N-acetyltransferase family protein [Gemmatimonadota bacterium]